MNTPAHLILGLAVFGKPGRPRVTAAALAGALIPDLSLYLLAGGSLAAGIPAETVFREMYYSDLWQGIFAVDNSVFVWGAVLALGLWLGRAWVVALAGAALLHLACDLPLHHDDGRAHFWPLTDWVFASPVSYWDRAHGAGWVAPLEVGLAVILSAWLLWRFAGWRMRALVCALLAAELSTGGMWRIVFG